MDLRPCDVGVWSFAGGYVVGIDGLPDEDDTARIRVCTTRQELHAQLDEVLDSIEKNGAGDEAENALKGK